MGRMQQNNQSKYESYRLERMRQYIRTQMHENETTSNP